ncbi:Myosin-1 [Meyerozyma sp. JA9]|nr:Myosin-1 [Meyerozyma sp. JA9]
MPADDDGFSDKNWVWVPDGNNFFDKGYITDYLTDGKCRVKVVKNGSQESILEVKSDTLENCNPPKFNKCDDMAELTHLNEPSVVYNLFLRYNDDLIYTYSGLFLVAINPYKVLPIYEDAMLKKYQTRPSKSQRSPSSMSLSSALASSPQPSMALDNSVPAPHIFATAENTFKNLLANKKDQSILVTGESGAGKTENTKRIIQYLSSTTNRRAPSSSSSDASTDLPSIDTKILQANPILESFGNAKTIKNNNSSRFGKFIKIYFSSQGSISGATIDYYLLEKSRVVTQAAEERNYHIFYQFLKGADQTLLTKLKLSRDLTQFRYLSQSDVSIPKTDDKKEFMHLTDSLKIMEFTTEETDDLFSTLAAILHMGNLDFTSWTSEQASFSSSSPVEIVAELLGISKSDLSENMLRPKVRAGREVMQKSKKASEAKFAIDAFAKYLYERIFQYIIDRINQNLQFDPSNDQMNFIGVLDIAGFEIFENNSFEQLCINYTNEKLQQFFNHHSFILEQSEYLREDIQWEFIDFGQDLQPTIDLIEKRNPAGILQILDEACIMPKSTDKMFMDKLASSWARGKSEKFQQNKLKSGFIVKHYAGDVEYQVDDWLQKNTDPVSENMLSIMTTSKNPFLKQLFESVETSTTTSKKKPVSRSAAKKHKEQLASLMNQLELTEPHFVRCILPNLDKKPNKFDKTLVLHQLRCNGVLEGIRITRAGYPNRMTFSDFLERYSILNKREVFTKNAKGNCEIILKATDLDIECYKVGITKIFFKNGILGKLEELRDLCLKGIFASFQSVIRGNLARKTIKGEIARIQASQVIAKTFKSFDEARENNPWFRLFVHVKPLLEESVKVLDTKEMNDNLKSLNLKLKEAESTKAGLEGDNEKLRKRMEQLEAEVINVTAMVKSKDDKLEKLARDEQRKSSRLEDVESKIKSLKKEKEKLSEEKANLTKQLTDAHKEVQTLKAAMAESESEQKKHTQVINALKSKVEANENKNNLLKEEIKKLKEDHERGFRESKSEMSDLQQFNAQLKDEIELHKSKHATLQDKLDEMKSKNDHLSEASEKQKTLATENSTLLAKIESLEETLKKKNDDYEEKKGDLDLQSHRITELEKELKKSVSEQETLRIEIKRADSTKTDLKKQVACLEQAVKNKDSDIGKLEGEMAVLSSELKTRQRDEALLSKQQEQLAASLEDIKSLQQKLRSSTDENDSLKSQIERLSVDAETNKKTASTYSNEIISLRKQVSELEESQRSSENSKENQPPDAAFIDEFASIKLKLNESTASLRKEKFENRRLVEEINLLKERISSGVPSPRKDSYLNRRSLAIGESPQKSLSSWQDGEREVETLKAQLEHAESNYQKAEHYAIELQKKLNKLQSIRSSDTTNDYEKKYKESQARIQELEQIAANWISEQDLDNSRDSIPKSESFGGSSLISKTLGNSNSDFVRIYRDITRTLKSTREELSASKSEILRLKALLKESEDELYDTKRSSLKSSVGKFEDELAQLRVKYENASSRNTELSKNVEVFKRRSEEYFQKLELSESAVKLSKRHEDIAKQELSEAKTKLNLAREEARATQIIVKDLRKQSSALETTISDKEHEIKSLKSMIMDLKDKLNYYNRNYENKAQQEKYKEDIRMLHKDLHFKTETETRLIKENKNLLLDCEDLKREKQALEEDLDSSTKALLELQDSNEMLTRKLRVLDNEKNQQDKKIGNLSKQIVSMKELIADITLQRDNLMSKKAELEEEISTLTSDLEATKSNLEETRSDLSLLREHLDNQREVSDSIKSELNQSKISSAKESQELQNLRKEILVTAEENESLKKVTKDLGQKVHDLEEKLYTNEQLKYWEAKVAELSKELKSSKDVHHESIKSIRDLERAKRALEIQVQNESSLSKRYNDENFEFQNQVNRLKSSLDILHAESSEKDLALKTAQRDNEEMRDRMEGMERELRQLRSQIGI